MPWNEAKRALPEKVDRVVTQQMVSDRPIGVFLSGGLDSSVVLTAMQRANPSAKIQTFTTRFQYESTNPRFNVDADLAAETAKHYGCEHHEVGVGPREVLAHAEGVAGHLGQPNNNYSVFATDAAARYASRHVPVVLGGDGGDELFGGYHRYRLYSLAAPLIGNSVVRPLARLATSLHPRRDDFKDLLCAEEEAQRILSFYCLPADLRRNMFGEQPDREGIVHQWREHLQEMQARDHVSRMMALDRVTWLRDSLMRTDFLTMRYGLEMRVPLIDDELIAFALSQRRSFLVNVRQTKRLWREAFRNRCSPEVIRAPKRGWMAPMGKWLRSELVDWSRDVIEEAVKTQGWMNAARIREIFENNIRYRSYHLNELWTVISYQLWWRSFRRHITEP
jgi:asparagine synthase (glutamine-hydrolysing)